MSKMATVIVVDVGKSMAGKNERGVSYIDSAYKAVTELVKRKIMYKPSDEISLVLFGTNDTSNALAEDEGEYQHIYTHRDLLPVDLDLLRDCQNHIKVGDQDGDVLDALIVALDILHRGTFKKKVTRRILLITAGAGTPASGDDEINSLVEHLQDGDLKGSLQVIGVDFEETEDDDDDDESDEEEGHKEAKAKAKGKAQGSKDHRSEAQIANEKMLREMAEQIGNDSTVISCAQSVQMATAVQKKSTLSRTAFKGALEITPDLSIHVQAWTKTRKQPFPSLKKLSAIAQAQDAARDGVKRSTTYKRVDNDEVIPEDEEVQNAEGVVQRVMRRVKGYKYGKNRIPTANVDAKHTVTIEERSLKVIGFVPRKDVARHWMMANVLAFEPQPEMQNDAVAFSSFFHALDRLERVALVRYVARKNAAPHMGILWPHGKNKEFLYFCRVPYLEDMRQYTFPPLVRSGIEEPTQNQLKAAELLINALDLGPDEYGEEALAVKNTFNPSLQYFYDCLQYRALNPDAPELPPLDPEFARYINQDPDMVLAAKKAFNNFAAQFPLKKREKRQNTERRWENPDALNNADVAEPAAKKAKDDDLDMDALMKSKVTSVGSANPVADFRAMMECRDEDLVDKAMSGLADVIMQMVEDSIRDQRYPKALEAIQTMREYAIKEGEAKAFNSFLQRVKTAYITGPRAPFWESIVAAKCTLISSQEIDEDGVPPAQATAFLSSTQDPKTSQTLDTMDADDLLDDIE